MEWWTTEFCMLNKVFFGDMINLCKKCFIPLFHQWVVISLYHVTDRIICSSCKIIKRGVGSSAPPQLVVNILRMFWGRNFSVTA